MRKILPILILAATTIAIFYKFFFQGLLPYPADLLVSFYFPWNSGGFQGFDPWTTRKDVIAMDVIRQIYPWKTLAFDLIRHGTLPTWNPYNFSGTPLLANLQSSIFFPGSLLFLILPQLPAWTINVIVLPFLFSIFSYIFLRSLNLSKVSAIFGAIILSNISYITVWSEQLVIIQSALFLPLILWLINKNKIFWASPLLALSLFGGHLQTTAYVYLIVFAYSLFKKVPLRNIFLAFSLGLVLSCVQLIPTAELYLNSAREGQASKLLFYSSTFPWPNLITFFAPDFFGNPATNNFRGMDYGNFQGYFGISALVLSLFAFINFRKNSTTIFFIALGLGGVIFSLSPFAYLFEVLKIPILSSGYPSRMIFIFQFSFAILAATGLDFLLKEKIAWKKIFLPLFIIFLIYLFSFVSTLTSSPEWLITRKNLVLPIALFLVTAFLIISSKLLNQKAILLIIIVAIFDYSYFFNKYQPFAPEKFVFPNHPVFAEIKKNNNFDRFLGVDRAYIDNNFATYYRVYSPEGYDPLYIRRYGELLSFGKSLQRSDALVPQENSLVRDRLLNLLSVKTIIDKTDDPENDWGPNNDKFDPKLFVFVKQINKWKFYKNKNVFPRALLFGDFVVKKDKIIETLFKPAFNIKKTLILEKNPSINISSENSGSAKIISYEPSKVVIKTDAESSKLLFLSDSFYPGWSASIDGKKTQILRADYSFRAVSVPGGSHQVIFNYDPGSFKIGLALTMFGFLVWILCLKKSHK